MKTTIDLPESLLRATKAAAALRGESMKTFIQRAIEEQCKKPRRQRDTGWRAVFGKGDRQAVSAVARRVELEFEKIDEGSWD